jgi:hypothetical protein
MFLFGGNVDEETRKIIKNAHEQFDNDNHDFIGCKEVMIKYVNKNCKTRNNPVVSLDPNKYIIGLLGSEGLYLTKKVDKTIGYLFNINNGGVYVLEYKTEHIGECDVDLPFDIVLLMMSNGLNNVQPVFLTN